MTSVPHVPNLAVLIDADNVSQRIADALFHTIRSFGVPRARRIYGDFSGTRLSPWVGAIAKHAITAQQVFSGKNASDVALIIDAVELLNTSKFDGFCIVSSDRDFAGLAKHIRERGVDVLGFGKRDTDESFRNSCSRFLFVEDLCPSAAGKKAAG
ncbi:MAG TPA: NYN domain-containing protein [Rhizomicrobium sp.]|nr:NYN domain-containing protein [Rhizomicrobium sp.]